MKKFNSIGISIGLTISMLLMLLGQFTPVAQAASLTSLSDTMSTLAPTTAANHTIIFASPTGIAAGNTVTLTFSSGFTGVSGILYSDVDFATGNSSTCSSAVYTEQTLAATASGATWGVASSGQVVTLTSGTGTSTAGNCVRFKIGTNATNQTTGVNQISNGSAGTATITMGGTFGDTGTITVDIAANTVAVTGTVNQTISFSLGASSVSLGTLSTSTATTGSHTIIASTNGTAGLSVTYSGTTLTSGSNTITAMSTAATSSTGTSQFGINAVANTSPSVGAACSGSAPIAAAATGYSTANNFKFVSGDPIVSSGAAINSSTCTVSYLVNIAGTTAAGSYSTTLTYVATGNF